MVRDEDGLSVLHVGTTGHDGVPRAAGLADEGLGDIEDAPGQVAGFLAQVDANERRDLVVTRAPRAELASKRRTGTLNEPALEGGMHVLIVGAGHEVSGGDVGVEAGESRVHVLALLVGEQADAVQLVGVRMRTRDVDVRQAEIKMGRDAQRREGLRRASGEAAAPQGHVLVGLRHG